ncbi:MAG TPA: hypothetical protein ENI20_13000 [Bacteroides sp.]|nr:hypothetical protein [Bacteroides sp.]
MKNYPGFILTLILIVSINLEDASAIPTFSRKYKTSCITCHAGYPRLNAFGEAFRYNGYKFPEDDEDQVKDEPVKLGSEAYKRVWPGAVWPSSIPGSNPISIRGRFSFVVGNEGDSLKYSEFGQPAIQFIAAANMTENIVIFAGVHLFENGEPGSIDRLFVRFGSLFNKILPANALSLRVGQFIPDLVPFASNHRSITQSAYALNTYASELGSSFVAGHAHGGGPFGIENFQLGVELNGIIKSRFRYVAGVVNGNGTELDNNSLRDYYGRLSYKIGGLGFDGSVKEGMNTDYETSLTIGIFGYNGVTTVNSSDIAFGRYGLDANLRWNKLNIVGGFIAGSDGLNTGNKYNLFFAETYYDFYPWLIGLIRYEQANPESGNSVRQIVPHISALAIANIRFKLESRLDPNDLKFNNLYLGLDFAF